MYSKELVVPEGVAIDLHGSKITVSGPKGQLEKTLELVHGIKIEKKDNKIIASSELERRKVKTMVGTILAHIRNMIDGVTKGFVYKLKVVFSHFPITVKVEKDKVLIQNFLGERMPRVAKIVGNTQVKVEGNEIIVSGINIEEVGQTCGNLEQATRRTGYDKKVFQDGIYIVSKGD